MRHDLDPEGCYCIMMRPISDYTLLPRSYKVSTSDCKPTKPGAPNGGETIVDMAMSRKDMVILMVLMGVILLFGMLLTAIACKPLFLSRLLGLKTVKARRESSLREQMVSRNTAVLLLHTPDISGSEHLAKLKQLLQNTFKVHDLFVYNDYKRLADPCGWMQEMLMPNSGVKLLVVESVGLMRQINSLLNPSPENPFLKKAAQSSPKTDDLLTYALWTIICTNLREDYSSVFVVKLSDEMKDVAELLVQTRRYKFPDHFSELIKAMTTTRLSHIRDEQQKSPYGDEAQLLHSGRTHELDDLINKTAEILRKAGQYFLKNGLMKNGSLDPQNLGSVPIDTRTPWIHQSYLTWLVAAVIHPTELARNSSTSSAYSVLVK
ncbi:hypothetical protein GWK47_027240 [Chionoecetes opilio]|uniref:Uncharacterized protein n=1 Tax=Chionoecetes opilio TaxID=41210 RepID=A0A8J8WCP6_CHIOP|nr:hypothetical protein GWK47_027240 [Chionoecetes opilio]